MLKLLAVVSPVGVVSSFLARDGFIGENFFQSCENYVLEFHLWFMRSKREVYSHKSFQVSGGML